MLTMGPKVEEFEAEIARICETTHALAVTSGTAALHLAVLAFDVQPDMPVPGLNYRLSDILCAVGIPQARRIDELLAARTRIAEGYSERLRELPVLLPRADDGDVHGWQAYVIQVDHRDRVLHGLR